MEVTNVRNGDILCYYSYGPVREESGTIYKHYISHSAIIVSSNNFVISDNSTLENVMLISKWGFCGVYIHNGDECPYGNDNSYFEYVKAYRPIKHEIVNIVQEDLPIYSSFYLNSSLGLFNQYHMYEINASMNYYDIIVNGSYNLDVRLYDEHMSLISTNQLVNGLYTNTFSLELLSERYYLRIAFEDITNSGNVFVTIKSHNHLYTYNWKDYTKHEAICACGYSYYEPHIVNSNGYSLGQRYSTCLICGGLAEMGFTNLMLRSNATNGQIILSNGVIMLIDNNTFNNDNSKN